MDIINKINEKLNEGIIKEKNLQVIVSTYSKGKTDFRKLKGVLGISMPDAWISEIDKNKKISKLSKQLLDEMSTVEIED